MRRFHFALAELVAPIVQCAGWERSVLDFLLAAGLCVLLRLLARCRLAVPAVADSHYLTAPRGASVSQARCVHLADRRVSAATAKESGWRSLVG